MKKSLGMSFLFIGTVVGAGFSSGREILTFFSGSLAPLAIFSCGVVFFLACYLLLSLASRVDISDIGSLASHFPQKVQTAFETLLIFCFIIICSMMIAGASSLFPSRFGISGILLFAAGSAVVIFGNRGLLKVNFILVPILLTFIIAVSVYHLSLSGFPILDSVNQNYATSIFEGVSYSSMNLLLSAVVLLSAGKGMKKREIFFSSALSATLISAVILLFYLAMNTSSSFLYSEMPIVPMTRGISSALGLFASVAVWIAIFTTFASSLSTCYSYFARFCKPPAFRFLIILALTYPMSLLGFSNIVAIFMPAMGVLGIALLLFCVRIYKNTKPQKTTRKYSDAEVFVTPLD